MQLARPVILDRAGSILDHIPTSTSIHSIALTWSDLGFVEAAERVPAGVPSESLRSCDYLSFLEPKLRLARSISFMRRTLTTVAGAAERISGTVAPHRCYVLLHSSTPVSALSSRVASPLQQSLQLKARAWGGLVNFTWSPDQSTHLLSPDLTRTDVGNGREIYRATAFSSMNGRLDIPEISLANLDDIDTALSAHVSEAATRSHASTEVKGDDIHIYVCTHGARDCRCGDMGGAVVVALRAELAHRKAADGERRWDRVRVGEVCHVGGHKYANLFIRCVKRDIDHVPQICGKRSHLPLRRLVRLFSVFLI